ncbi:beta-L-arabinofuranosidase domain-containing protein [Leucobacter sp. wl10]|uniref:beta-L-arabinofuranosidase domain-containing protein n=1 Tax=Leucobacter sp. wl10 TaxID=2304677 RepID=UPI000E5C3B97|nr:beta-L-arabinofuranosidase domain-containing protein [Leucobacter sp. wl10]RGE16048.1 glycosyl hydrolase [Leucobacter sp. wl10]
MNAVPDRALVAPPAARELPVGSVRLGPDSVFRRAETQMLHLARVYPVDRLLAVFRRNAGLDTLGARPPGTWEDFGHPNEEAWGPGDYPGRERAQTANLLRGHYAGHFLSMLSLASATQRDEELRAKVEETVAGLGEVQAALAATGRYSHPGFLAAYGEWQFSRLEAFASYGEIWAPYYTCHKIMAGLLDAYELVGNAQALELVTGMAHWVHGRLAPLDEEQRQSMWALYIAGEFGGMNETLARLGVVTSEPLFLETARFFDQRNLLEAGAEGRDILTGMHANQHLPQLLGYLRDFEATGDRARLDAVVGLWDQIVPGRTYAHGGSGENELWGPPNTVAGDIGHRNAETCVSYNMLKIARALFAHTLDPKYAEYAEATAHDHILGSRRDVESDTSPEVTYMFPVHPGALREYDNVGTCCGGTGLENHVGYAKGIAFESEQALWITRTTSSEIDWERGGLGLRLASDLPAGGATVLIVERAEEGVPERTIGLRLPEWAAATAVARVGSEEYHGVPGAFIEITRRWAAGDRVEVDYAFAVRCEPTVDDPDLAALRVGPNLLLARSEATTALGFPFDAHRALDGTLRFDRDAKEIAAELAERGSARIAGVEFEPVWSGTDSRYHMYVRRHDAEIAFAGVPSGVPNRVRPDGSTFLSTLWGGGGFASRGAMLARVAETALAVRREGLLSRDEFERVLDAALDADLGGPADAHARADFRVEALAEFDRIGRVPPFVAIETETDGAASGWFTAVPLVSLQVLDLAAAGDSEGEDARAPEACEVRIDAGAWQPYTGPFHLADQGLHVVRARVRDAAGLEGHASREFAIDTEAPEAHASVKRLGSSVEITLHAEDAVSGVESIQWQGPGTFWATFQEAFVRALTEEEQVIEFAASDRAGNESARRRLVLPSVRD